MAVRTQSAARAGALARPCLAARLLEREAVFSWLMLGPAVLFLLAFVAYPFVYGIVLSIYQRGVAQEGTFVGFGNFSANLADPVFWQVARNTFIFTTVATVLKLVGGVALALVMNQQ